jgi:hypothetical protein
LSLYKRGGTWWIRFTTPSFGLVGSPSRASNSLAAESEGMVRRYAHLAPAHLAEHAEVIAGILGDTNSAQTANDEGSSES